MPAEGGEKTEPATPRRRMEARTKGQVARSNDIVSAALLLAGLILFALIGPAFWQLLLSIMRATLEWHAPVRVEEVLVFAANMAGVTSRRLSLFLGVLLIITLLTLLVQTGWLFTTHPLTPNLTRLDPLQGFKRLLSPRSLVAVATNSVKVILVVIIAYITIRHDIPVILFAVTVDFSLLVPLCGSLVFKLGFRCAVALLVLALIDVWWQRYRFERDLRMTKEEVKDELRSMEGDPLVKRRQRQIQLQLANQRLRKEVPKADVIVTNPTHYAVAIAYEMGKMPAPRVVAKGVDEMALRIREIATEFAIPMVERRALARALYDTVDVGKFIPEAFYHAIAEILAYVYELTGRTPLEHRRGAVSRSRR
jgi:flagellar biosynthetic protein FlhB